MSEEWKAQYNKAGRLWFLGVDVQENPGGTPEARSCLCVCLASFLMTFATGGIPHAGSRQWRSLEGCSPWGREELDTTERLHFSLFTFHFHSLEKKMATHSSVLAWRIPGTGEPGGLPSMGSHRVGHD